MTTVILLAETSANVRESGGDSEFREEFLMSTGGYIAAALVLFCIGFFGFFLNLFVIILMCKEKQVRLTFS